MVDRGVLLCSVTVVAFQPAKVMPSVESPEIRRAGEHRFKADCLTYFHPTNLTPLRLYARTLESAFLFE